MSDVLAAVVVEALLVGGRLAMFAAGFTILFGGIRMPFVAYGQVILLGAYGIWTANAVLQQNYFVAAAVAFVALIPLLRCRSGCFVRCICIPIRSSSISF